MSRRRRQRSIKSLVGNWRGEQVARETLQDRLSAVPDDVLFAFLRERGHEPANRGHAVLLVVRQYPREAEQLLTQGASASVLLAGKDTVSDTVEDTVSATAPDGPAASPQSPGGVVPSTGEAGPSSPAALENEDAVADTVSHTRGTTVSDTVDDTVLDTASDTGSATVPATVADTVDPHATGATEDQINPAKAAGRGQGPAAEVVADTVSDTESNAVSDTVAETVADTVFATASAAVLETVEDTVLDTGSATASDTAGDTVSDTVADTARGDAFAAPDGTLDAAAVRRAAVAGEPPARRTGPRRSAAPSDPGGMPEEQGPRQIVLPGEIGRASCRERV